MDKDWERRTEVLAERRGVPKMEGPEESETDRDLETWRFKKEDKVTEMGEGEIWGSE